MKQREGFGEAHHQVIGKWQAVLGDFDVSLNSSARATIWASQTSTTVVDSRAGPRGFLGELTMAPEVRLQNEGCTRASDMYSYGGLLFVALYPNSPPVTSEDGGIEVGEHANVDVAALVRKLLRKEAKERPSASEALAYPLFAAAVARGVLAEQLERKLRECKSKAHAAQSALRSAQLHVHTRRHTLAIA
jgi:serine/threonine protein kinase